MDAQYYNSLAIALNGDYETIKKVKMSAKSWPVAFLSLKINRDPEADWQALQKRGLKLILSEDKNFPDDLRHIPFPPFALYVKGHPLDKSLRLAIVGTRKATPLGKKIAEKFSEALSKAGVQVVSGLALGIDGAGQEAAAKIGCGTIAVLACGLDKIYPAQHERLANEIIIAGGTIVSEYPVGTPALPHQFLQRNRIVSGLSKAVLIIEAPIPSGALSTARFAVEQNKDVFVVPGPINHPNYQGSNQLIRQGAMLITKPEEILEALGMDVTKPSAKASALALGKLAKPEQLVLDLLTQSSSPLSIEEIINQTKLEARLVSESLTALTIENLIIETQGRYSLN